MTFIYEQVVLPRAHRVVPSWSPTRIASRTIGTYSPGSRQRIYSPTFSAFVAASCVDYPTNTEVSVLAVMIAARCCRSYCRRSADAATPRSRFRGSENRGAVMTKCRFSSENAGHRSVRWIPLA